MPLDRVIFIFYQPGSFGSFLSHCINFSNDLYNSKYKIYNNFNLQGAAHINLREYINQFHDGAHLRTWYKMSDDDSELYLKKNYIYNQDLVNSGKWYTNRCTVPLIHSKVKKYFPLSKYVNITYDADDVPIIARMFANKTLVGFLTKKARTEKDEFYMLKQLPKSEQIEIYEEICKKQIDHEFSVSGVDYMYDFAFKWFYNKNKFMDKYNEMCNYLEITPGEISELYDKFSEVNKIKVC